LSTIRTAIENRLSEAFHPTRLIVEDVSWQHAGHAGYREGVETHFNVTIEAEHFRDLNRVDRQRAVLGELQDLMNNPIHALSIRAAAPS
jgi:BolA protein